MKKISEPDWKVFKEIKIKVIDTFCNKALSEFEEVKKDRKGGSDEAYALLSRLV